MNEFIIKNAIADAVVRVRYVEEVRNKMRNGNIYFLTDGQCSLLQEVNDIDFKYQLSHFYRATIYNEEQKAIMESDPLLFPFQFVEIDTKMLEEELDKIPNRTYATIKVIEERSERC